MPDSRIDQDPPITGPAADAARAVGRVLGNRYRLVAPLGAGSSARVYLADDLSLNRRVAVKCLRIGLSDDSRFLRRFRAEAQAAAQLSHPNLLAVFDWGEDASAAYIVTEVLLGGSLLDLLDRSPRLTPSQGLLIALQVAQGLNYAHGIGWVHRDIKPANLLFGREGRLRIADFGIARAVAEAAWTEPEGVLVGTARYAAPEQAGGDKIDGKADIYSLAMTIVEAVSGTVPLLADNALATMVLRQDRDVGPLDHLGPLGRALAPAGRADPEKRPSAAELIDTLTRTARDLPRPRRLILASPVDLSTTLEPGLGTVEAEVISESESAETDATEVAALDLGDGTTETTLDLRHRRRTGARPTPPEPSESASRLGSPEDHRLQPGDRIKSRPIPRPRYGLDPAKAASTGSSWLDQSKLEPEAIDLTDPTDIVDGAVDGTVEDALDAVDDALDEQIAEPSGPDDVADAPAASQAATDDPLGPGPRAAAPAGATPPAGPPSAGPPSAGPPSGEQSAVDGPEAEAPEVGSRTDGADVENPPSEERAYGRSPVGGSTFDRLLGRRLPVDPALFDAATSVDATSTEESTSAGNSPVADTSGEVPVVEPEQPAREPRVSPPPEAGASTGQPVADGGPGDATRDVAQVRAEPEIQEEVSDSEIIELTEDNDLGLFASPMTRSVFGPDDGAEPPSAPMVEEAPGRARRGGRREEPGRPVRLTRLFEDDPDGVEAPVASQAGATAVVGAVSTSAAGPTMEATGTGVAAPASGPAGQLLSPHPDGGVGPAIAGAGERVSRRPPWLTMAILIGLIIGVLGLVVALAIGTDVGTEATTPSSTVAPGVTVGDYVGERVEVVEVAADDHNWLLSVSEARSDEVGVGRVIEQEPASGTLLQEGDRLNVVVSTGVERATMPSLVGLSVEEAEERLEEAGLTPGEVIEQESEADDGEVIGVEIAGSEPDAQVELDAVVDLVVSAGPTASPMPSFVGLTLDQAIEQADELGLEVTEASAHSERYDEGFVIDTDPPTDAPVKPGDQLTIVVSLGQPFIAIPDVAGLSVAEAAARLRSAGFEIGRFGFDDEIVVATSPSIGETHRKGHTIDLIVATSTTATTEATSTSTTEETSTTDSSSDDTSFDTSFDSADSSDSSEADG